MKARAIAALLLLVAQAKPALCDESDDLSALTALENLGSPTAQKPKAKPQPSPKMKPRREGAEPALPVARGGGGATQNPSADLDEQVATEGPGDNQGGLDNSGAGRGESDFQQKLETLMQRLDKSIAITRKQISDNPGAPFLADLFLQLAQLTAQKAEAVYYLEVERAKKTGGEPPTGKSSQVVRVTREAVQVLKVIETDFPGFPKRPKALLLLTAAYKSLQEQALFKSEVDKLAKEFPGAIETAKARLMLGESYFDIQGYEETIATLKPVTSSEFAYERDAAKYRTGLAFLALERWRDGMDLFEQVVRDPNLEQSFRSSATGLAAKSGGGQLNLKREALIDSIRAYTKLYPKDPDPIAYYSALAPTEIYFQEVMEKLAFRYITINQPQIGIRLLRALAERIREPYRVVKIYFDVLSKLPEKGRLGLEPNEMLFVLQNLRIWLSYYTVEKAYQKSSEDFFEKEVRDLGTSNHDRAKLIVAKGGKGTVTGPPPTGEGLKLLNRAAAFYEMYLTYFPNSSFRVKMAINLADVQFLRKDFLACGQAYLRTFQKEYGPPEDTGKLIQNSILCFQSNKTERFYDNVRNRGLLIKAIRSYMAYDKKQEASPRLNFALLKAQYDQAFYDEVIPKLFAFMKRFKSSTFAVNAGDLILDFYNIRNDLKNLAAAADTIISMKLPQQDFVARVKTIKKQVAMKKLNEKVDILTSKGSGSTGDVYLQAALSSGEGEVREEAFQQALAASKAEGNIETFLKAASLLVQNEKQPDKKAQLTAGMAIENLKITRYYRAMGYYEQAAATPGASQAEKDKSIEQAVGIALSLRDAPAVARLTSSPAARGLSQDARTRAGAFYAELLEGSKKLPDQMVAQAIRNPPSDDTRVALFKLQEVVSPSLKQQIQAMTQSQCGSGTRGPLCAWQGLQGLESQQAQWIAQVRASKEGIESIEKYAKGLEGLVNQYGALEGTGDPQLDTIRLIRLRDIFKAFAAFLRGLATRSPDLKPVLDQKAAESEGNAKKSVESCLSIAQNGVKNIATPYCDKEPAPRVTAMLHGPLRGSIVSKGADSSSPAIAAQQKKLFAGNKDATVALDLSAAYLDSQDWNHAMAAAVLLGNAFPERESDFAAVAGCAAIELGLPKEATYHLKKASDYRGLKARCWPRIGA